MCYSSAARRQPKEVWRKLLPIWVPGRIAMEVGTHSPWVKRLLESWNHEVIVANAHRVRLITESTRKDDRLDARKLARLARADPELLSPIRHRSEGAQAHLAARG